MDRTAAYIIIVTRTADGYTAVAPAFPDLAVTARGSRVAYARLKLQVKARLLALIASGRAVPRDPVVQTKTLRVDLWYLRQQEELQ
jgi:alkylhydroperoxidase/carboxymuconolactone decarboxylase family protein YurZ